MVPPGFDSSLPVPFDVAHAPFRVSSPSAPKSPGRAKDQLLAYVVEAQLPGVVGVFIALVRRNVQDANLDRQRSSGRCRQDEAIVAVPANGCPAVLRVKQGIETGVDADLPRSASLDCRVDSEHAGPSPCTQTKPRIRRVVDPDARVEVDEDGTTHMRVCGSYGVITVAMAEHATRN
jgi:hypothetical protein